MAETIVTVVTVVTVVNSPVSVDTDGIAAVLSGLEQTVLVEGDVVEVLKAIPDGSVHCAVTSPPYYGLRDYHLTATNWGGKAGCSHEWQKTRTPDTKLERDGNTNGTYGGGKQNAQKVYALSGVPAKGSTCVVCGAWSGNLGLEPTPEMYIRHLVQVFGEVKRVLRDDGVFWLNIGDSYVGGKGQSGYAANEELQWKRMADGKSMQPGVSAGLGGPGRTRPLDAHIPGLKTLDKVGIPERLILALQQDGWYWRATVVWASNRMPQSVRGQRWERHKIKAAVDGDDDGGNKEDIDCPGCEKCTPHNGLILHKGSWRPTNVFEYVYMLTKSDDYFCNDADTREPSTGSKSGNKGRVTLKDKGVDIPGSGSNLGFGIPWNGRSERNMRNVWNITADPITERMCAKCGEFYPGSEYRKLSGEGSKRQCVCGGGEWIGHYAAYPSTLIEPLISASTSRAGVCALCGAQYAPVIEAGTSNKQEKVLKVVGYEPTCPCPRSEPIPALIIDPFVGSGTTCIAARHLGLRGIGIDLNPQYLRFAQERVKRVNGTEKVKA